MAKSRVFWLTKDKDSFDDGGIWIWQYVCHPQMNKDGTWTIPSGRSGCVNKHEEFPMCDDGLAMFTGITLKPGQRVKARLVIKENEK